MSKPAEIEAMVRTCEQEFGALDILVNNAGIQHVAKVEDFPPERWDAIIAINLTSAFHTTRLALPGMKRRNWGRILNIASTHGLVASAEKSAYVASKHGILGFTKSIALETATTGITVNAICPGWVLTPLVQKQIDARAAQAGISVSEAKKQLLAEKQPSLQFTTHRATRRARRVPVLAGRRQRARRGVERRRRLGRAVVVERPLACCCGRRDRPSTLGSRRLAVQTIKPKDGEAHHDALLRAEHFWCACGVPLMAPGRAQDHRAVFQVTEPNAKPEIDVTGGRFSGVAGVFPRQNAAVTNTELRMNTPANTRPDRIVVVDDDARIRDLLRRYLTQEGIRGLVG